MRALAAGRLMAAAPGVVDAHTAVGALSGDLAGPGASRAMGLVNVFSDGQMLGPFRAGMAIDATATEGPALTLAAAVSIVGGAAALITARRLGAVTPAAIGG